MLRKALIFGSQGHIDQLREKYIIVGKKIIINFDNFEENYGGKIMYRLIQFMLKRVIFFFCIIIRIQSDI